MVAEGARFTAKHRDEFDREWDRWLLVRRGLGVSSFGLNIVEVEPGGSLTEHDEFERDQEEVFVFLSGTSTMVIDGQDVPAPAGTFVRVSPRGEAHRSQRGRHGRRGADHLGAVHERLRADGLGLRGEAPAACRADSR